MATASLVIETMWPCPEGFAHYGAPGPHAERDGGRNLDSMRALGVICGRSAIQYTLASDSDAEIEESELSVPASRTDRGDQLTWLLDEAEGMLHRVQADIVLVKKAGTGQFASAPERHEVEAVVQIASHRLGIRCELKTTDQLRALAGVPKGKGAYEELLKRPDVVSRSNKDKRERYLYAVTALTRSGRA